MKHGIIIFCLLIFSFSIFGQTPDTLLKSAQEAIGKKDYATAISILEKVIAADPKNAEAYARRAFCYISQVNSKTDPRLALARADAEKALLINSKQPHALGVRGVLKNQDKDYDGAFADLEESYAIDSGNVWVKNALRAVSKISPAAKVKIRDVKLPEARKKVESDIWNYHSYEELSDLFSEADVPWEERYKYWENLLAANPRNLCAVKFASEKKSRRNWSEIYEYINFLNNGLSLFDGKSGAECASQIALTIGNAYNANGRYNDAETYFKWAKEIDSTLKYLQQNIEASRAEKEKSERRVAASNGGGNSSNLNKPATENTVKNSNSETPKFSREIQNAYDTVHRRVEALSARANRKVEEFNKQALVYDTLGWRYRKEREISAIRGEAIVLINQFLKKYEGRLPQEMIDHLNEDREKLLSNKPL